MLLDITQLFWWRRTVSLKSILGDVMMMVLYSLRLYFSISDLRTGVLGRIINKANKDVEEATPTKVDVENIESLSGKLFFF